MRISIPKICNCSHFLWEILHFLSIPLASISTVHNSWATVLYVPRQPSLVQSWLNWVGIMVTLVFVYYKCRLLCGFAVCICILQFIYTHVSEKYLSHFCNCFCSVDLTIVMYFIANPFLCFMDLHSPLVSLVCKAFYECTLIVWSIKWLFCIFLGVQIWTFRCRIGVIWIS